MDHLIVVLPDTLNGRKWPIFPYAETLKQRFERTSQKQEDSPVLVTDLPNKIGTHVVLAFITREASSFERLTLARKLVAHQLELNPAASHGSHRDLMPYLLA